MKASVESFESAIILDLESLYVAEAKLEDRLAKIVSIVQDPECKNLLRDSLDVSESNKMRVERILSYFNREPHGSQTDVIGEMLDDTFSRLRFAQDDCTQTVVLIACLQRINDYKLSVLTSCLRYADALDLNTPSVLIESTIQDEQRIKKELLELCNSCFLNCELDSANIS